MDSSPFLGFEGPSVLHLMPTEAPGAYFCFLRIANYNNLSAIDIFGQALSLIDLENSHGMAKLNRETVIAEALDLLDEVGLDVISTRQLAVRLGVEQPSLYWHFHNKQDLLAAMAQAAMAPHAEGPLPKPSDDWRTWFADNSRSFRRTLLMRRDGARLHAGSRPQGAHLDRIMLKFAFLVESGFAEHDVKMSMLAISHFTVGNVLEAQAEAGQKVPKSRKTGVARMDFEAAFEAGLALILDGLAARKTAVRRKRR